MIERDSIAPWENRDVLDKAFVDITGDRHSNRHYLHDCPTFEQAIRMQEQVQASRWDNEEDARAALNIVISQLDQSADNDGIMNLPVTISGQSLRLPIARVDSFESRIETGARRIGEDEFVPETMTGVTGKLSGFYYDLIDCDDHVKAKLVYQVLIGRAMIANVCALQFATADVSHLTTIDFAHDCQTRELMDAVVVFEESQSHEVSLYVNHLLGLVLNSTGGYSAEDLNTIADIIQMLSVHDDLKEVRQRVVEALEVIIITGMTPRLAGHPHNVEHTAGIFQIMSDAKATVPVPYETSTDEPPAVIDAARINEIVVMPILADDTSERASDIVYEPYLIARTDGGVCYVPLSKITSLA